MDTDVDEGSEFGHVRDHAFKRHAGLKVADLLHAVVKAGRQELVARIASGFAEFLENVVQRVNAHGETAFVDLFQQGRLLDNPLDWNVEALGDLFDYGIGLGVNGGDVERVIAVTDPEETGGLLKSLRADPGHGRQLDAGTETAMLVPELDDFLRGAFVDAGDVAQQGPGRGVEVHADA